MITETEKLIKQAGFGENARQAVRISLTEAEAAAVYASEQSYEKGDVLLVCDAGGGTTDVNILRSHSFHIWANRTQAAELGGGASHQKLIMARLEQVRPHLQGEPRVVAEKMMSDRFESFKCSFGAEAINALDLLLPIPGMAGRLDFPQVNVRDSKIVITW